MEEYAVELVHYYYGHRKTQFMLPLDTYTNWVAMAAEEGEFVYELGDGPEAKADDEDGLGEPQPIGGRSGKAVYGELLLCPPGMPLRRHVPSAVSFHFMEFVWKDASGRRLGADAGIPYGLLTVSDRERLASDYRYLRGSVSAEAPRAARLPPGHFVRDLLVLALHDAQQQEARRSSRTEDRLVDQIAAYMQERVSEQLSMGVVAERFGLAPSQLTRRFQAAFGKSPIQYMTSARLHKAKELLIESTLTIDHIAQLCGYLNGFYMSRVFTGKTGISPSEFRRAHRI